DIDFIKPGKLTRLKTGLARVRRSNASCIPPPLPGSIRFPRRGGGWRDSVLGQQEGAMDEFDLIADALGAVRMIQGVYGTSHDGAMRIDEVAQILQLRARRLSGEGEPRQSNTLALAVA